MALPMVETPMVEEIETPARSDVIESRITDLKALLENVATAMRSGDEKATNMAIDSMIAALRDARPRPAAPLSSQQRKALEAVRSLIEERGYPPSVRELGKVMNLASSSTVHGHLVELAKKGYIEYGDGPRRIRLLV